MTDTHRLFRDRLYGQLAGIGNDASSPHRLEILELLIVDVPPTVWATR